MNFKKITTILLATTVFASTSVFAEDKLATRGYTANYFLEHAKDYNPTVKIEDIIKGYENGELKEEENITKAQAYVMFERAFGDFPELTGDNKRIAFPKGENNTVPLWAKDEINKVFDAGLVDSDFNSEDTVTEEEIEKLSKRAYSLFGTNLKDDFYATINKDTLNTAEIKPGRRYGGSLYDLDDESDETVAKLVDEILENGPYEKGTVEQKISDYYYAVTDKEGRKKVGLSPIMPYINELNEIKSIDELNKFQMKLINDLDINIYLGFGLSVDAKDSTKYMLSFGTLSPSMNKDFYKTEDPEKTGYYLKYIKNILTLSGEDEKTAEEEAKAYYNFEKEISKITLEVNERYDISKTYNIYTLEELQNLYKNVDLSELLSVSNLKNEDRYRVADKGLIEEFSKYYNDDNIELLKAIGKIELLAGCGSTLDDRYIDISNTFNNEYLGTTGQYSDEERAKLTVQSVMNVYLGKIYAQRYFNEESKKDVTEMIENIISTYEKRIDNLDWMSDETKTMAKKKLKAITIKVGYPDSWETFMDDVEIKPISEGGSYFANGIAISKAYSKYVSSLQGTTVDKTEWLMDDFTVNACYCQTANDITFPAAILQSPFYNINASKEENYAGIGYVIAHEITHAFDNNGAKYDENGNAADWWKPEDYEEFNKLCDKVVNFYDGVEAAPGIESNGTITLSENIADLGAYACVCQIVSEFDNPDYKKFFEQIAKCWATVASRETIDYLTKSNVHSFSKLRVNQVIVNNENFYKTYDIKPGDGMYVAPEDRVKIW